MTDNSASPEPGAELTDLRARLAEAEETLRAIRAGEADALVIAGTQGDEVYLLDEGDRIYRQFIEAVSEGMATLTADGEIQSCNASLADTLRRPIEQLLGSPIREHLSPDDHEVFGILLARAGQESRRRKIRLKTSGGDLVPVYLSATLLCRAGAEPVCCLVFTDLEEVISAEVSLRGSEARYRALYENIPDAVLLTTPDGSIISANPAACSMFGRTEEELRAVGRVTVVDTGDPRLATLLKERGRTGRASGEITCFRKDGSSFPAEISTLLFNDRSGATRASMIIRDSTERLRLAGERAQLEGQLLQAQKIEALGRLAGGVAHDFNNLTAIVLGYGEMLLERLRADDPARSWTEQIVAAGKRSAALTRQLLAFSRKQMLQPVVLDLNALLLNLEKMLGRLIGEDIALQFDLAGDLGRITADPGQIEQVVTNLVLNARDAMPRGGRLTVGTANVTLDAEFARNHKSVVPGKYIRLVVADTGSGMDQATQARLFEPFFTTKAHGKGTGLGLATAFGIVKQSGGYLYVASQSGKGSTFTIYLPWTHAQPNAAAFETGAEPPLGGGERILVAEDEESLRELCAVVLSRLGYRVGTAGSGPEALTLVGEQGFEPDLVLTDVVMPGMSGAELAARLRRERPELKVLYMSGYPDEAIAPHGVLRPGISFLQKPFTESVLAAKVHQVLGGARLAATPPARRVLLIDDDRQFSDLMRHFCEKRGHAFAGVDSAAGALAALAEGDFDVLLVDLNLPGTSGARILRELRAAGHGAPAIVLTGDKASADMDELRPLGVRLVLEKSSRAEPLLRAIEEVPPAA